MMDIDQAFIDLISHWEEYDAHFRDKYKSYRSRFFKGKPKVGFKIKREMLLKQGYIESWAKKPAR